MVKRVLTWGGVAFLLFFIALRPDSAADVFMSIGSTVADIGQAVGNLVKRTIS